MVSNKKIYKLSKEIRKNNGLVSEHDLLLIQEYRTSFSQPLSTTFHKIRRITDKVDRGAIVAFRLKRIGTIINKLLRLPDTYITTMGDVAGIRCIFNSNEDVYKALKLIISKFECDDKIRDYIKETKGLGYKGVHVYVKDFKSGKKVEVQLRTKKAHNWATLVEITDLLYGLRLKEIGFDSDPKFAQFHALLSSDKELTKEEAFLIYDVLKEKDFISKLGLTFRKNNNEVKKRWAKQNKNHSYFLIEASKDEIPMLNSFSSFKKAEEEYFKRYKKNDNANVVLTSIRKPNFKQISIAYANYILSYHNFMTDIMPILKEMATETIEEGDFSKFKSIFKTYEELQANMLIYAVSDSSEIIFNGSVDGRIQLQSINKIPKIKEQKIMKNLNNKLIQTGKENRDYIIELKSKIPKKVLLKFKFNRFLKKHNKRLKKRLTAKEFDFESLN